MTQNASDAVARSAGSREQNLSAVFTTILTRGPISRRDAARATGLSPAAVTRLAKPMISHGYVVEQGNVADGPGRPQVPLAVHPDRHHAVGIKVMQRELVGVVVDLHAEIKASRRVALRGTSIDSVVRAVRRLTEDLLAAGPFDGSELLGVGIGLGGHVEGTRGYLHRATTQPWRDVPLRELLSRELGLRVLIENDVNTLAVAEQWFGAAKRHETFAVVTVGAGVGCGLVLSGQLWRGTSGAAGEFGHIVVAPDGPPCECGKRGCLESLTSDAAMLRAISERSGRTVDRLSDAVERAHDGDPVAREVFAEAGTALGRGLSVLVNLLNLPLVILSGEGVSATDLYIDALHEQLAEDAFSTTAQDCTVLVRPLPDETWARGAAAAMLQQGVLASLTSLSGDVPI